MYAKRQHKGETPTQGRGTSFQQRRRPNAPLAGQLHGSISPQVANLPRPERAPPYSPRKAAPPRKHAQEQTEGFIAGHFLQD